MDTDDSAHDIPGLSCPDLLHGCPVKERRDDGSEKKRRSAIGSLSLTDTLGAFFPSPLKGEGNKRSSGLNRTAVGLIRVSRVYRCGPMDCREREALGLRPPGNGKKGNGGATGCNRPADRPTHAMVIASPVDIAQGGFKKVV